MAQTAQARNQSQNETALGQDNGTDAPAHNENWDSIVRSGGIRTGRGGESIHCLSIIGQIEGHFILPDNQKATKYEHIIPLLLSLEESDEVDGVLIILHTMGGDVEAGLALAEMIASMTKPSVSLVLGGGHSIGVPLAVAAKQSFIVPSATMTIHPVRISGTVLGAPQTYRYFHDMQQRIVRFVTEHSGISEQRLTELMMCPDALATDVGSVLEGEQAVREGLIGAVGGLSDALRALRRQIASNTKRTPKPSAAKAKKSQKG